MRNQSPAQVLSDARTVLSVPHYGLAKVQHIHSSIHEFDTKHAPLTSQPRKRNGAATADTTLDATWKSLNPTK
jgi:hypothetical protein